jgi:hypothetical protein
MLFAHLPELRDIHEAPHHIAVLKIHLRAMLRACGA